MKAFLLAAGKGTRLRPLTYEMPKCLLPIDGQPLMQIWLELMGRYGVDEVLINTHWLHHKVEEFLEKKGLRIKRIKGLEDAGEGLTDYEIRTGGSAKSRKMKVRLFYEPELLGSAGTLWANQDWIAEDEDFFILYGDNLTNVNLKRLKEFHLAHSYPFTLGVFRAEEPERCGIAEVDNKGLVTSFVEKPEQPKSDLAAAGINVANKNMFEYSPERQGSLDLGFDIFPKMVGKMKAYVIEDFLMDIGTMDSYERAQELWDKGSWY